MEEFDRSEEFAKYGPGGYWPEGTPPPRRVISGRAGIEPIKQKIIALGDTVPTIEELQALHDFADVHRSDIIDALSMIEQEAK